MLRRTLQKMSGVAARAATAAAAAHQSAVAASATNRAAVMTSFAVGRGGRGGFSGGGVGVVARGLMTATATARAGGAAAAAAAAASGLGARRGGVGRGVGGKHALVIPGGRRTIFIQTQSTPNPASLMFLPGKPVYEEGGSKNFSSAREAMAGGGEEWASGRVPFTCLRSYSPRVNEGELN